MSFGTPVEVVFITLVPPLQIIGETGVTVTVGAV